MDDHTKPFEVLENALSHVRERLAALEEQPMAEKSKSLDALNNAKLRIAMAYSIGSMYYMLLKSQGENPLQHPVKGELDRIKGYVQKAQQAEQPIEQRKTVVNEAAARRVIQHELKSNSTGAAPAPAPARTSKPSTGKQRRADTPSSKAKRLRT